MKSKNVSTALFISISYFAFLLVRGTLDLENRMTAVHSLAKKTKYGLSNYNPNVETYFGLPIYDYSLGFGTNLPITSGLSRISTLTFFIDVPDDILTLLFLSLLLFITLWSLVLILSTINNLRRLTLFFILVGFLYPLVVYTFINDWPDVAISYLSLILIQSSLFLIRQNVLGKNINSLAFSILLLGACVTFYGQVGYFPVTLLTVLAQIIVFGKLYLTFFKAIISDYKLLAICTTILFFYSGLNLYNILNSENRVEGQLRDSQELKLNLNLLDSRQPSLVVILFIFFLIYHSKNKLSKDWIKELFLAIGILLIFWNSSNLGIFSPSSEWLIRDYFWIQLLLLLAITQKKKNKTKNQANKVIFTGLTIVFLGFYSPLTSIITTPSHSRNVSWINQAGFGESEFYALMSHQLLTTGDRVLTAPSELIRNRGSGISGLISYTDLTSQGITSISSWSKMRDSSIMVYNKKMFENRAFLEDCNRFIVQLTAPTLVIIDKSLSFCNSSVQNLGYQKTWSNDTYNIYRGTPSYIFEIKTEEFSSDSFTKNPSNLCGLLQQNCESHLKQELLSKLRFDEGGPFCRLFAEIKGWCLEFDKRTYERYVILPILFEETLYSHNKLDVRDAGGLTSVKIPANFQDKIILQYRPSFLDSNYYASSLVLSLFLVFLSARVSFHKRFDMKASD